MRALQYTISLMFVLSQSVYAADAVDVKDLEKERGQVASPAPKPEEKPDDEDNEDTEAKGPCLNCETEVRTANRDLKPIPIREKPAKKDGGLSLSSIPWMPILALGGGMLAGYALYKMYQSNMRSHYIPPTPYQPGFPTCRTYLPGYMPGGSPYASQYMGYGGGCGTRPYILPPWLNQPHQVSFVGSPQFGQPYGLGSPPPILPYMAQTEMDSSRVPASAVRRERPLKPMIYCPTVNYFDTAFPLYDLCI
ncbi:MAG TPA: hypothetical protein DCL41_07860 [Bdellovibrionales bacterium]|nr:hypothetical protein [Bdellovibrionales bacterium]